MPKNAKYTKNTSGKQPAKATKMHSMVKKHKVMPMPGATNDGGFVKKGKYKKYN